MRNKKSFELLLSLILLIENFSFVWSSGNAGKILMLPFPWKSHVSQMLIIGKTLVERGHEVAVVLPASFPGQEAISNNSPVSLITYHVAERDFYGMPQPNIEDMVETMTNNSPVSEMRKNVDGFSQFCSNPLSDEELFRKLKEQKFDLAFVDSFPCSRCLLVLPYRLGIPYVSTTTNIEAWVMRVPAPPSFVPFALAQFFTDHMNFWERLSNTYQLLDWSISTRIPYISDDFIRPFVLNKPFVSLETLERKSKLWLMGSDVLVDYPAPSMPYIIDIGGLTTKPAKSLPEDILQFVEGSQLGFVIVSFGSFDVLRLKDLKMFLEVFSQLPEYRVVLRTSIPQDQISNIPPHVKLMSWIPQNDILGHPKCRLFITHCGANGQFEALYHGVPMLGFPVFGDQPYNARRMARHGYGRHMDIKNFSVEELSKQMTELLTNDLYRDNIARASRIFRSRPMNPRERAAFWIEQVLEGNVDHLHSPALDMPWYEYLMLDIIVLVALVPLVAVHIVCCLCCRYCAKNRQRTTKVTKVD